MNYGKILKKSWDALWQHKILIGFGLIRFIPPVLFGIAYGAFLAFFANGLFEKFETFFNSPVPPTPNYLYIFLGFLAYLALLLLGLLLNIFTQTTVSTGALLAQNRNEKLGFQEIWKKSKPYFGRVLGVLLLAWLASFILFVIPYLIILIAALATMGFAFLCIFPFILVLIPLAMVWYIFKSLSIAVIITEDLSISDTFARVWSLLKEKFWHLILLELILGGILFLLSAIMMIPSQAIQFFYLPMLQNPSVNYYADIEKMMRTSGLALMLIMPVSSLVQGLGVTFSYSTWIFALSDITAPKETAETKKITEEKNEHREEPAEEKSDSSPS
jgi:hypothetical protein